jgi:subtilisin family serine protease
VSSKRRPAAAWVAVGGFLTAVAAVPMLATPAHAYAASGTITHPLPAGNGSTDLEFSLTCPTAPSTQGVNGWVFALPASVQVAGTVVGLTGSDAQGLHDLVTYVYKDDCSYSRVVSDSGSKDLYVTLEAGDAYLSVFTANGVNTTVDLAAPATPPSTGYPNDPLYLQAGADDLFFSGQWNMRKVNAVPAWSTATGSGIKVAVLDTGLDLGHPDFDCTNKVELLPNGDSDPDPDSSTVPEDDDGHGTHTAGIIGACANNGVGVVGIAPDSTLMPIQILSATSTAATLATGIRTAADAGAHVINMSIGFAVHDPAAGLAVPGSGTAASFIGSFAAIDDAITYAQSKGVVVVAAAGNESTAVCGYPAIALHVVCVGSSDPRDLNAWYGNFPVKDDDNDLFGAGLLAPGGTGVLLCDSSATEIISTYDRSADAAEGDCDTLPGYASIQGTSMASPLVAGAAALVYQHLGGTRSAANAAKVVEAITASAKDLYTPGWDPMSGSGRLDALAAVNYWP